MSKLQLEYDPILINFKIPKHLKYHLDRLVKFKGISRTSILINLIEGWIHKETEQLENDGRVYELMSSLENTIERSVLRQVSPKEQTRRWEDSYDDELPVPVFNPNESEDDFNSWR